MLLASAVMTLALLLMLFMIASARTAPTSTGYSSDGFAAILQWLTNLTNDSADHVAVSIPFVVAAVGALTLAAAGIPPFAITKWLSVRDVLALTVWLTTCGLLAWSVLVAFVWIRGAAFDGVPVDGSLASVVPGAAFSLVLSVIVGRFSLRPLSEQLTATRARRAQLEILIGDFAPAASELTVGAQLRRLAICAAPVVTGAAISVAGIACVLHAAAGVPAVSALLLATALSLFGIGAGTLASLAAASRSLAILASAEKHSGGKPGFRSDLRPEVYAWIIAIVITIVITGPLMFAGTGGLAIVVWLFVALGAVVIRVSTSPFATIVRFSQVAAYESAKRTEIRLADLLAVKDVSPGATVGLLT